LNAVAITTNKHYLTPLKVVLYGLNKTKFIHDIVILYDVYFNELEELKSKYTDLKIILRQISVEEYKDIKWVNNHREWHINPFYRFEIFKLDYEKILYLDLDIVILKDINEIFDQPGNFRAVELAKMTNLSYVSRGQRGFNAGVMLIDKSYLNKDIFNNLCKLARENIFNGNQKVFNMLFTNIDFLDVKYNLTTDLLTVENIEKAHIIHYIGENKPWDSVFSSSFCQYVKRLIGEHLLIKVYNIYCKELNEALK